MRIFCNCVALDFCRKLREKIQKKFPSRNIQRGVAIVQHVEEIFADDCIFGGRQMVLCENVPTRIEYYLIHLVFQQKHHKVRSHQVYPEKKEVGIEYVRRFGGIRIIKIHKKLSIFIP